MLPQEYGLCVFSTIWCLELWPSYLYSGQRDGGGNKEEKEQRAHPSYLFGKVPECGQIMPLFTYINKYCITGKSLGSVVFILGMKGDIGLTKNWMFYFCGRREEILIDKKPCILHYHLKSKYMVLAMGRCSYPLIELVVPLLCSQTSCEYVP